MIVHQQLDDIKQKHTSSFPTVQFTRNKDVTSVLQCRCTRRDIYVGFTRTPEFLCATVDIEKFLRFMFHRCNVMHVG